MIFLQRAWRTLQMLRERLWVSEARERRAILRHMLQLKRLQAHHQKRRPLFVPRGPLALLPLVRRRARRWYEGGATPPTRPEPL